MFSVVFINAKNTLMSIPFAAMLLTLICVALICVALFQRIKSEPGSPEVIEVFALYK